MILAEVILSLSNWQWMVVICVSIICITKFWTDDWPWDRNQ
jgi:hypothetical protein